MCIRDRTWRKPTHGSFVSSPTNSVTADFKASPSTTSNTNNEEEEEEEEEEGILFVLGSLLLFTEGGVEDEDI